MKFLEFYSKKVFTLSIHCVHFLSTAHSAQCLECKYKRRGHKSFRTPERQINNSAYISLALHAKSSAQCFEYKVQKRGHKSLRTPERQITLSIHCVHFLSTAHSAQCLEYKYKRRGYKSNGQLISSYFQSIFEWSDCNGRRTPI